MRQVYVQTELAGLPEVVTRDHSAPAGKEFQLFLDVCKSLKFS